ncbi:MAG: glycosyltransferase [Solirubrobacterales bacterium]
MRVLLVTSMVPDAGGIGAMPKLFEAQLQGLSERHEVTLLAGFGEDPGQAEAAERLLESDLDAHFVDRRRSASPLRRWRVRAELASTWATRGWPWRVVCGAGGLQPLLDDLIRSRGFDVIAVEDNPVAVLRFPGEVPTVLTEHEAVRAPASEWRAARLSERPLGALRAFDWRRWDAFLPSAWGRFDLVQVYCEADAEAVRGLAPGLAGRIRVNPYGIVLPPALDPAAEQAGTILFSGTFAHLPNRDAARWLVGEIMPAIRARHPQAQLRIAGSAPPREVLDLAGRGVEVIADPPSMEPHLRAAAVVLAPVRSGGGMRMKVLEAIARQKAVVTTALGAEGFNCFEAEAPFVLADDPEAIAGATAALLEDAERRRELGLRGRQFAIRHHSPAAWALRLEAVYEEARHRHRPPIHAHQYPGSLSSPAESGT